MPRLEFNRATRRAIIDRANGHCEGCQAVLKTGEGEVDHILPDALGGKPEASNGRLLCRVCHKAKTGDDIRRIRSADRQRDKRSGAMPPAKVKIRSAGFPKTSRSAPRPSLTARPLYRPIEMTEP